MDKGEAELRAIVQDYSGTEFAKSARLELRVLRDSARRNIKSPIKQNVPPAERNLVVTSPQFVSQAEDLRLNFQARSTGASEALALFLSEAFTAILQSAPAEQQRLLNAFSDRTRAVKHAILTSEEDIPRREFNRLIQIFEQVDGLQFSLSLQNEVIEAQRLLGLGESALARSVIESAQKFDLDDDNLKRLTRDLDGYDRVSTWIEVCRGWNITPVLQKGTALLKQSAKYRDPANRMSDVIADMETGFGTLLNVELNKIKTISDLTKFWNLDPDLSLIFGEFPSLQSDLTDTIRTLLKNKFLSLKGPESFQKVISDFSLARPENQRTSFPVELESYSKAVELWQDLRQGVIRNLDAIDVAQELPGAFLNEKTRWGQYLSDLDKILDSVLLGERPVSRDDVLSELFSKMPPVSVKQSDVAEQHINEDLLPKLRAAIEAGQVITIRKLASVLHDIVSKFPCDYAQFLKSAAIMDRIGALQDGKGVKHIAQYVGTLSELVLTAPIEFKGEFQTFVTSRQRLLEKQVRQRLHDGTGRTLTKDGLGFKLFSLGAWPELTKISKDSASAYQAQLIYQSLEDGNVDRARGILEKMPICEDEQRSSFSGTLIALKGGDLPLQGFITLLKKEFKAIADIDLGIAVDILLGGFERLWQASANLTQFQSLQELALTVSDNQSLGTALRIELDGHQSLVGIMASSGTSEFTKQARAFTSWFEDSPTPLGVTINRLKNCLRVEGVQSFSLRTHWIKDFISLKTDQLLSERVAGEDEIDIERDIEGHLGAWRQADLSDPSAMQDILKALSVLKSDWEDVKALSTHTGLPNLRMRPWNKIRERLSEAETAGNLYSDFSGLRTAFLQLDSLAKFNNFEKSVSISGSSKILDARLRPEILKLKAEVRALSDAFTEVTALKRKLIKDAKNTEGGDMSGLVGMIEKIETKISEASPPESSTVMVWFFADLWSAIESHLGANRAPDAPLSLPKISANLQSLLQDESATISCIQILTKLIQDCTAEGRDVSWRELGENLPPQPPISVRGKLRLDRFLLVNPIRLRSALRADRLRGHWIKGF